MQLFQIGIPAQNDAMDMVHRRCVVLADSTVHRSGRSTGTVVVHGSQSCRIAWTHMIQINDFDRLGQSCRMRASSSSVWESLRESRASASATLCRSSSGHTHLTMVLSVASSVARRRAGMFAKQQVQKRSMAGGGPAPEWEGIDKVVRGVFPGDHQCTYLVDAKNLKVRNSEFRLKIFCSCCSGFGHHGWIRLSFRSFQDRICYGWKEEG